MNKVKRKQLDLLIQKIVEIQEAPPVTHKIVQWGEKKFEGTLEKCRDVKKLWTEQHGNIDLDIVPIKFPT